jgi:hypothetical protein
LESQTLLLRKKLCTICPGDMRRWVKLTIEGKSSEKGSRSIIQKMVAASLAQTGGAGRASLRKMILGQRAGWRRQTRGKMR